MSVLFVHVITLLVCIGWAVGRGSDAVSGEISRGTMDLILALPIRRATVIGVSAAVTAAGALVLGFSVWLGCWLGSRLVTLPGPIQLERLLPGVWNLAAMTFCLAGLTTLLSALDHNRWRTVLLAGGLFIVSTIVKLVSKMWEHGAWMKYLTFLTAFEPQRLSLLPPDVTHPMAWWYNSALVATGLAGYAAAAIVFSYRDIPAPR
jgi:ABC-2 type transport system permease protein